MTSHAPRTPRALTRSLALAVSLAITSAAAAAQDAAPAGDDAVAGPGAPDPAGAVIEVLHARPFALARAYPYAHRADRPDVDAGVLLVLRTDPALLVPRQAAEPVLFVGDWPAQRVNVGDVSGHLVVVVPAARDGEGRPVVDLSALPVFFGAARLPEAVDAAAARAEREAALARGVTAPAPEAAAALLRPPVAFTDAHELLLHAADLVEQVSPDEVDLVSGLRVPRLTR